MSHTLRHLPSTSKNYVNYTSYNYLCLSFPYSKLNAVVYNNCEKRVFLNLQNEKKIIVAKHNELRSLVAKGLESRGVGGKGQPSAANMKKLSWDDELSDVAQT